MLCDRQVEQHVAVPENKIIDIRLLFYFLFGKLNQVLPLLAQVGGNTAVLSAAIGPSMRQRNCPPGMNSRKTFSQEFAVKDISQKTKRSGIVAQPIAVREKEFFTLNSGNMWLKMKDHSALLSQVVGQP